MAQAEGAAEAAALLPVPTAVATMALEGPAAVGRLPEVLPGQVLPYPCAPALQAPLLQLQVCTLPPAPYGLVWHDSLLFHGRGTSALAALLIGREGHSKR